MDWDMMLATLSLKGLVKGAFLSYQLPQYVSKHVTLYLSQMQLTDLDCLWYSSLIVAGHMDATV